MLLIIKSKNGQVYEEVRTVEVEGDKLTYCRSNYYAGEEHTIDLNEVDSASIDSQNGLISLFRKD